MTLRVELDSPDRLKVHYRVETVSRVMLGLLALVPFSGAFAMLRGMWDAPLGLGFVFFSVLGLAAALVGAGMLLAAGGSNDEVLDVDRRAGTVTRFDASSLGYRRRESRPLSQISRLETGVKEWSDSPTYHLTIHFQAGSTMKFGSSNVRPPIDQLRDRLAEFLAV